MSGNGIGLSSGAPTAAADVADEISRDELLRRLGDPTLVDVLEGQSGLRALMDRVRETARRLG